MADINVTQFPLHSRSSSSENRLLCLGLLGRALGLYGGCIVHFGDFGLCNCLFHLWEIRLGLLWHDPVVVHSVEVDEDW